MENLNNKINEITDFEKPEFNCEQGIDLNTYTELQKHENKLNQAGEEIAKALGLSKIRTGDEKGRYNTAWGTKTPIGLARVVMRILSESGIDSF